MRNLGFILLLGGVLAFFYCTSQLSSVAPLPADAELAEYIRNPAGRFEIGRYLSAGAAFLGVLLVMFPRGR